MALHVLLPGSSVIPFHTFNFIQMQSNQLTG